MVSRGKIILLAGLSVLTILWGGCAVKLYSFSHATLSAPTREVTALDANSQSARTPATITPAPTKIVEPALCLALDVRENEQEISGYLLLDLTLLYGGLEWYDLSLGEKIASPCEEVSCARIWLHGVSPDKKWAAYSIGEYKSLDNGDLGYQKTIVIADARGKEHWRVPWQEGWSQIYDWLDDHRLLIEQVGKDGAFSPESKVVLDIFTHQVSELQGDFAGLKVPDHPFWMAHRGVVYNSTLTRAVYSAEGEMLHMVDLSDGHVLASVAVKDYGTSLSWSPDGKKFVWVASLSDAKEGAQQEVFLLTDEGEYRRLTELTRHYGYVHMSMLTWSPDSVHLAFALEIEPGEQTPRRFYPVILNTLSGELREYCLPTGYISMAPVDWSPDGRYVLLGGWREQSNTVEMADLFILDWEEVVLYPLPISSLLAYWLSEE